MVLMLAAMATMVMGQDASHYVGLTGKVGTLGIGGDLTVSLGERANARVGLNWGEYDYSVDMDEADVDGDLDLQTIPILLDLHPAAGGFRFSLGVVLNRNEVALSADPKEPLTLDGIDFDIDSMNGTIEFDELAYYVGIGYGDAVGSEGRWNFACDFGVMYHGTPDVTARATATNPAVQGLLDASLAKEVDEFEDDSDPYKWYPVVALGVSFAF
jgi:hypothetical protein